MRASTGPSGPARPAPAAGSAAVRKRHLRRMGTEGPDSPPSARPGPDAPNAQITLKYWTFAGGSVPRSCRNFFARPRNFNASPHPDRPPPTRFDPFHGRPPDDRAPRSHRDGCRDRPGNYPDPLPWGQRSGSPAAFPRATISPGTVMRFQPLWSSPGARISDAGSSRNPSPNLSSSSPLATSMAGVTRTKTPGNRDPSIGASRRRPSRSAGSGP